MWTEESWAAHGTLRDVCRVMSDRMEVSVPGGAAAASTSRDVLAVHSPVFAQHSLSDVGSGACAATGMNSDLQSSGGHAAHKNPGIVSAGLGVRGPEGGAAKSKSAGGPQPRAESKVDKNVVATLGQLSAHFAIWRASKDGFLRMSSSHGAPEDIACSEHGEALMNHIISADGVAPSDSKDFKKLYTVCV